MDGLILVTTAGMTSRHKRGAAGGGKNAKCLGSCVNEALPVVTGRRK